MWISPSYRDEYCSWIAQGNFETIRARGEEYLPEGLHARNPVQIAGCLGSLATCYYRRGTVGLMQGDAAKWADVQAGYWAALYRLLFNLKAVTFTLREVLPADMAEMVLMLGLARLFRQDGDALRLTELIDQHFNWDAVLGDRIKSGRKLLASILDPAASFTQAELLTDRKECCQKRDAWPTRPTEIGPFGVLDIEIMSRFPENAAFQYSGAFSPTDDDLITCAIVEYHASYERPRPVT
jgi:hypothetical protein